MSNYTQKAASDAKKLLIDRWGLNGKDESNKSETWKNVLELL